MSFNGLLIHSVTISNPTVGGGGGRYGDPVPGAPTTAGEMVRIQPIRRTEFFQEDLMNRDTRKSNHIMYAKTTSIITALSTVTWGSRTFRVLSMPATSPDGVGTHHLEVQLEEVEG